MAETGYGALAAALAKAQAAFPTIPRDKEVTVQTKVGGSYKFKYAPLDTILAAVRQPLAANGLAIVQLLDEDVLVTSLLHESGAILSGRTPIPLTEGVQAYGSAITYLRRYSIQALLGIAAEEDDDGNRAAGNAASFRRRLPETGDPGVKDRVSDYVAAERKRQDLDPDDPEEPVYLGAWAETGHLIVRKSGPADGELRQGPDGPFLLVAFGTVDQKQLQVEVRGGLAEDLAASGKLDGLVCTVEGDLYRVPWRKAGKSMPPYQRLVLARIHTAEFDLPKLEAPTLPLFPDAEAELDAIVDNLP